MNPAQAVRILNALSIPASTTVPAWPAVLPGSASTIWTAWKAFPPVAVWQTYAPGTDIVGFWMGQATAQPASFLDMVLFALTRGFVIPPGPTLLATAITNNLLGAVLTDVSQLAGASPAEWQAFFAAFPNGLPTFIQPGNVAAFISYLQKFFEMGVDVPVIGAAPASSPLRYPVPSFDLINQTILAYGGFAFGAALALATLEAAAAAAIPGDPEAQAWVVQAIWTINELFILANVPKPVSFQFSVIEALFARGFTTREEVQELSLPDFQQALTGTVAFDFAPAIYINAGPPIVFPPPPPPGAGPINPCCLTDCIPPLYLSPLGPVAYLHEMLKVSERSTCEHPFAAPAPGHTTLQAHIDDAARAG